MNCCFPYLPVNPCCTPQTDPCTNPCTNPSAWSSNIVYKGPNLPCTGINNCDTLSTAIQKIEAKMCEIIDLLATTTSTTTIVQPTTTSTTTIPITTTTTSTVLITTTTTTTIEVG